MVSTNNISIKDIAKMSGFSVSTVSRVLNNTGRFSQSTRDKIINIAEKYNYQQNAIAAGMRKGSLSIIGIIVPDITNNYYAALVKKCEQYFFKKGYLTIVCNTDRNPDWEKKYINQLSNHFVDGLVVISTQPLVQKENISYAFPVVFIDRFPKLTDNMIITSSDNYAGAALATNHLIDNDAYPIMVTTKDNQFSTNQQRLQGFIDTAQARGIKDPEIIALPANSDDLSGAKNKLMSDIQALFKQHKKIGAFAVNDNVGVFIYRLAIQNNIKIPDQLSIVGFDDSAVARETQLTTIHQNINKLAETSCKNLLKLLKKEEVFNRKITIPVSLIKRKTT